MTDSFSNLVHRPTIDQFTEGMTSKMSSPAWTVVAPGPGREEGSVEGRREKLFIPVIPRRLCYSPDAWDTGVSGGRLKTREVQPSNTTS